jgi:hypothetical protein
MCGASLLNNDDTDVTDHRNTDVTATASVTVMLVLLLLKFQCSVKKSVQHLHQHLTSLGVCYIVLSVVIEYKVVRNNVDVFY